MCHLVSRHKSCLDACFQDIRRVLNGVFGTQVCVLKLFEHFRQSVIRDTPTFEYVRFPLHVRPRITRTCDLIVYVREITHGTMSEELRHVVMSQPLVEGSERRSCRVRFEEAVILHALEHNEPIPMFGHQGVPLGVHTLYARQDSHKNLFLCCRNFGL